MVHLDTSFLIGAVSGDVGAVRKLRDSDAPLATDNIGDFARFVAHGLRLA